ncbi:MAG: hypothetical protein ABEJ76_08590 [Halanaeroarchaeum sp.]
MSVDADRPVTLVYPAFGPIDALLGFALFYFVVGTVTVVLTQTLASVRPSMVPEPVGTWAAIALWVVFALTVVAQGVAQWESNPRRFDSAAARTRFLERGRPDERRYRWWGIWVLIGGVVAYWTFPPFVETLAQLTRIVAGLAVDPGPTRPVRFLDLLGFVGFFLGYALMTRGIDRLVVGSLRALLADWFGTDEESRPT